jgi:insertion element IS1 protein InsB
MGIHLADRSRESAKKLWRSLPGVYRQCAKCYTDFWAAYVWVISPQQHQAVGKDSGPTNHIERFNCTLRQRVSRLVRKTLSFSKKLENHIGAILFFIHLTPLAFPFYDTQSRRMSSDFRFQTYPKTFSKSLISMLSKALKF